MNGVAHGSPMFERAIQLELFDRAHRTVEGDPRHHLRLREMFAAAADLPDALIRLFPNGLKMSNERTFECPARGVRSEARLACHIQRIQNFPVHISLIHISEPTRQAEISYAVFCL